MNYLQTDFKFPINKFGCYFMCLCVILGKKEEEIEGFFDECAKKGYLRKENCYILRADKILGIDQPASWESKYYEISFCNEIEILEFIDQKSLDTHFVIGDGKAYFDKNYYEHIYYDSMGLKSIVDDMVLNSKRVFSLNFDFYKKVGYLW